MKKTLSFAILWTIFSAIGTIAIWNDAGWTEKAPIARFILSALPAFGAFFMWWSWRRFRRYHSVRIQDTDCGAQFVWVDLDGKPRISTIDPRIQWDEDDRLDDA